MFFCVINAFNEALSHLQCTPPAPPPKQTLQALLCFSEGQHGIQSACLYTDKGCSQLDGQFYPSAVIYAVTEWSAFFTLDSPFSGPAIVCYQGVI